MLQLHQNFISNTLEILKNDDRIEGIAIGGSYIYNSMDEYSDLDFVIVTKPEYFDQIMSERKMIAGKLGQLLASFTGEHVGEPRLLICLYGPSLLHVDLKFVSLDDVQNRVENPAILWERNNKISDKFKLKEAKFPHPDLQWIEDRFWVWVHYGATKLGRKEIFEVVSLIDFLRKTVIGPLTLIKNNKLPRGVRKLEFDAPCDLPNLIKTVPNYDFDSCTSAFRAIIDVYRNLREEIAEENLIIHSEAEKLSVEYLEDVIKT
jgi:predicted nucleotidyltransferase